MKSNVVTGFDGRRFVIMLHTVVAISIVDLMWAVIKSIFERRKNGKRCRQFDI